MLWGHKNAQLCPITSQVASFNWWMCDGRPWEHTSTIHNSQRGVLWCKVVHFYMLLALLYKRRL